VIKHLLFVLGLVIPSFFAGFYIADSVNSQAVLVDKTSIKDSIDVETGDVDVNKESLKKKINVENEIIRPWDSMPSPTTGRVNNNLNCENMEIDYEGRSMRPMLWESMQICAVDASNYSSSVYERGMLVGADTGEGWNVLHMIDTVYSDTDSRIMLRGINYFEANEKYDEVQISDVEYIVTKMAPT